eukprot:4245599-Amphidinium_carterae.1
MRRALLLLHARKLSLEDARDAAAQHGGVCLSKEYVNNHTPMLWECGKGHQWWAQLRNIRSGCWCPQCASNAPLSIEDADQHARTKGGACLTRAWKNSTSKLLWRCNLGHEWTTSLRTIRNNDAWCPTCARLKR